MIDVQNRFAYLLHIPWRYVKYRFQENACAVAMLLGRTKFKTTTVNSPAKKPYNFLVVCLEATYCDGISI